MIHMIIQRPGQSTLRIRYRQLILILNLAAVVLIVLPIAAYGQSSSQSALVPDRLYYQVDQPIPIEITATGSQGRQLVLLTAANEEVARTTVDLSARDIDLAELFPEIYSLREVHYLQLVADGASTGASVTLQPLTTRPTPVIQYSVRGERRVPKVVDWEDPSPSESIMSGFRIYEESVVILHTTHGDITLIMRPDEAPNTVWNFRHLVDGGFFVRIPFHRVVAMAGNGHPFVIQAGDPSGTGAGGCAYNIDLEPSKLRHDLGVISMAREGRDVNTASSQFFLCLSRPGTEFLDGQYTTFGQTIEGLEVIQKIGALGVDQANRPVEMPYIETAETLPAMPREPGTRPEWMQPSLDNDKKADGDGENGAPENRGAVRR